MKTKSQSCIPSVRDPAPKPIKFTGLLSDFKDGQLCFVVARRYQGKGPVKLILHRAFVCKPDNGFGYGHLGAYIVSPASLMGSSKSPAKTAAARLNGVKGGRPKTAAIFALQSTLAVLENNEPINRREGKKAQANLERKNAAEIKDALEVLGRREEFHAIHSESHSPEFFG